MNNNTTTTLIRVCLRFILNAEYHRAYPQALSQTLSQRASGDVPQDSKASTSTISPNKIINK